MCVCVCVCVCDPGQGFVLSNLCKQSALKYAVRNEKASAFATARLVRKVSYHGVLGLTSTCLLSAGSVCKPHWN